MDRDLGMWRMAYEAGRRAERREADEFGLVAISHTVIDGGVEVRGRAYGGGFEIHIRIAVKMGEDLVAAEDGVADAARAALEAVT